MAGEHLTPMSERSEEERQEMLAKASEKRHAKREWAEENLKLHWDDHNHWKELASKHRYRLPNWTEKAGSKFVNRFLKHFGLDKEWYQGHTGYANGNKEFEKNSRLPAFAQVGLLLEAYDEDFENGRI